MSEVEKHQPFTPDWYPGWIGWTRNESYQDLNSTGELLGFTLSIIEFDDQGRCYSRYQLANLFKRLDALKGRNPVILVFAHGWKHNGSSGDSDLGHFVELLEFARNKAAGRPVLGVFLAWRGLSFHTRIDPLMWITKVDVLTSIFSFLSRKQAAMRVAMGAPRELLERLRKFKSDEGGNATFIVIGHSFGALIVYNALAQSLVRSAIAPTDRSTAFANLILLVNAAFEGARYLPVHDIVREHFDTLDTAHDPKSQKPEAATGEPIFVSVTALNDWATGWAFPIGMLLTWLRERVRGKKERKALTHTIGHIDFMRTHELSLAGGAVVTTRIRFSADNPFWVMSATKEIINGHNGIWQDDFRAWAQALLRPHLR